MEYFPADNRLEDIESIKGLISKGVIMEDKLFYTVYNGDNLWLQ